MAVLLLPGLLACSSISRVRRPFSTRPNGSDDVQSLVSQPFADLNVTNPDIPPLLERAIAAPYELPKPSDCAALNADISQLSAILGPDLEPANSEDESPIVSKSTALSAAWSAAHSTVNGLVPFRGIIRFVTGAERHDTRVAQAVLAGFVRRAFLNGLRVYLHCPASPATVANHAQGNCQNSSANIHRC